METPLPSSFGHQCRQPSLSISVLKPFGIPRRGSVIGARAAENSAHHSASSSRNLAGARGSAKS